MMMPNVMGMPNFMGGMAGGMAGAMGQPGGMPFQLISGAPPQGSSAGFFPLTQNNQK